MLSGRVLVRQLRVSRTSIHRILKKDLKYRPYKKRVQPILTDAHKAERKAFAHWIRASFRKEQTISLTRKISTLIESPIYKTTERGLRVVLKRTKAKSFTKGHGVARCILNGYLSIRGYLRSYPIH